MKKGLIQKGGLIIWLSAMTSSLAFGQDLCSVVDKVAAIASKETPIYLDKATYLNSVMGLKNNCSMTYRYITDDNMYVVTPQLIQRLTKSRREYWDSHPELRGLKSQLKLVKEQYTSGNTGRHLFTIDIK
jgi:hypothetical protein